MIDFLGNLIERIKTFGLENVFNRYYSSYRAKVIDNKDPEKRGRIKVKIPVLFGDDPLPNWVLPKEFRGAGFNSSKKTGKGEFYPPKIDDWVFVEFEMGSLTAPMWSGGWFGEDKDSNTELPKEFTHVENEPMVRGYRSPEGSRILYDETKEKTKLSIIGSDGSNADAAKEQSLIFNLEKDKEILALKSIGHTFTLDDTKDKEVIALLSKIGTKFEITEKGTFKVSTKYGHTLTLDDEAKTIDIKTKDGADILLKDKITIADSKSKSTITISSDGVKIITEADLTMESKKCTVKAKEIAMDGGGGKLSLKSNKVAIGSSSAEVVDSIIKIIDAFTQASTICGTGVGPSGPLLSPLMTDLVALKVKLNSIKGSL